MKGKDIKCCCIILNYNDAITTLQLLQRIEEYTLFQAIIIVDNMSTDDSLKQLKRCANERVHVICSERNGGYGYGNNYGVTYAIEKLECNYALIANPDVYFEENIVKRMLSYIHDCEEVALVAPMQLDSDMQKIRDVAWKIPTIYQYIFSAEAFLGKYLLGFHYPEEYFVESKEYEVDCVPGSLLLIDTDIFSQVGGYDEDMFLYCEETTLGYKLKKKGYKTILMTECTYVHEHSVSINRTIKNIRHQRRLILQSRFVFLRKYLKANYYQCILAKVVYFWADLELLFWQRIKKNRV